MKRVRQVENGAGTGWVGKSLSGKWRWVWRLVAVAGLAVLGVWRVESACGPCNPVSIETNCVAGPMTLVNVNWGSTSNSACPGVTLTASTTLSSSNGQMTVTTNYFMPSGCPPSPTNCPPKSGTWPVPPTVVSNCYSVSGPATLSGCEGLEASFTATNCGSGSVTFTVVYDDGCGAFHTIDRSSGYSFVDTNAPTITCPANLTVNTDTGVCYATGVTLGAPSTSDNCGVAGTTNDAPTQFDLGPNAVIWTGRDRCDNTASCTQLVIVVDQWAPQITCPTNRVICIGGLLSAPTNATDNCGTPTVTPAITNLTVCGTNYVTWVAVDASQNSNQCTETVLVYAVDSLRASEGSALDGPTNYVCCATSGVVTVTAGTCGLPTANLPSCWSMSANGSSLGQVTSVDITKTNPAITTVIATAGTTSKTNVVIVARAEVKTVTFTSDHGVLTDYNADFAGGGGTVYNPRGWRKDPATNNPITHVKGTNVSVSVTVKVEPAGVKFDLVGSGNALNFSTNGVTSTGGDLTLPLTSLAALPVKIDILNETVSWMTKFGGAGGVTCGSGNSGPHKIYVLWGVPGAGPTLKRINWVCISALNATTAKAVADGIHNALDANPPRDGKNGTIVADWRLLDGHPFTGECQDQADLMVLALRMIGHDGIRYLTFASRDAANVILMESKLDALGRKWWLKFDFDADGKADNNFEGSVEVDVGGGVKHYYAVWPSLESDSMCGLLRQIGPDSFGAQQIWVRTWNDQFYAPTVEDDPNPEGYPVCP